jgi:hypothetical protein
MSWVAVAMLHLVPLFSTMLRRCSAAISTSTTPSTSSREAAGREMGGLER